VNPDLPAVLDAAGRAMAGDGPIPHRGFLRAGVDLGTVYVVLLTVDEAGVPLAGAYETAEVVRDGVVLDFHGAAAVVRRLRARVERRLGVGIPAAATCHPPGIPVSEVRATRYVLEAAGMDCSAFVEEPVAANSVLGVRDGAVVDIGGGTTGIAVIRDGNVVYTADEPTGGTHLSLVIAGAMGVPLEDAEARKLDPAQQAALLPVVRPVLEKIGTIVAKHLMGAPVDHVYLVGGTAAFPGIADVVADVTGLVTSVPGSPLFVTPIGVALHDPGSSVGSTSARNAITGGPPDG
jgi:ethanolamine utilization protein EutJ